MLHAMTTRGTGRRRGPGRGAAAGILVLVLAPIGGCAGVSLPPARSAVVETAVTFQSYSPLSAGDEVARRTLTPLTYRHVRRTLTASDRELRAQAIDLGKERFTVYRPAGDPPPGGYGLLVFVAPWPAPTEPRRWRPPLDRHRLVFVAAAGSGNDASLLDRRLPLALLAYENVRARLPIDPGRVYVGGFSGGSRLQALR